MSIQTAVPPTRPMARSRVERAAAPTPFMTSIVLVAGSAALTMLMFAVST